MIKCDNCSNPAQYKEADPRFSTAHYCAECLPPWLQDRANSGHFELIVEPKEEKPTKSKKKAAAEPVEEAPVEEPVVEEAATPDEGN